MSDKKDNKDLKDLVQTEEVKAIIGDLKKIELEKIDEKNCNNQNKLPDKKSDDHDKGESR